MKLILFFKKRYAIILWTVYSVLEGGKNMFETILQGAMVVISIVLIILCLLQSGKSDDIVNALTGQSSNLFAEQKERGIDLVMSRMTMILAIAFFVIAVILRMD